jgi:hypothetical protein
MPVVHTKFYSILLFLKDSNKYFVFLKGNQLKVVLGLLCIQCMIFFNKIMLIKITKFYVEKVVPNARKI